jgi:hypothetical protein
VFQETLPVALPLTPQSLPGPHSGDLTFTPTLPVGTMPALGREATGAWQVRELVALTWGFHPSPFPPSRVGRQLWRGLGG